MVHITLTNVNPNKSEKIIIDLLGSEQMSFTRGEIITGAEMNSLNDFGKAEEVTIKDFNNVSINGKVLSIELPAKSVVMVELN